jgi:MarR family transcriptional regulator, organic hydroperoxide resistance regulator
MPSSRLAHTSGQPSSLPEVLTFMQLLWAVVHAMDSRSKRMAREIGVTGPQRLVLRVVGLRPGLSAGDLASVLHVHPSTLTGILKRLVNQGLITRIEDSRDRRRAVLQLTRGGRRINAVAGGTVEHAIAAALKGSSHRDHLAAARLLMRMAQALTAHRPGDVAGP